MSIWICYTDGGCQGNPGPCAWGAVIVPPTSGTIENAGFLGHGTNQIAELSAALHGIGMTPVGAEVLLISDSQYTLKGLTEWRRGWESKGFRNSKGEIVANLGIWKLLYAAADLRRVKTQWVKGHSGQVHNERCDVLAAEAIRAGLSAGGRPATAATPVISARASAVMMAASTPARAMAARSAWTPVWVPEPECQTVLYALVEDLGAGPKITRAETGLRQGTEPGKPWATHWMPIPGLDAD